MRAFRIDRKKREADVLSGRGAELYGGRWNIPGIAAVYAAETRALAILEMLVHLDLRRHWPADRILVTLDIPDEYIEHRSTNDLASGWSDLPYGSSSQTVFGKFTSSADRMIALTVPSSIVPQERNVILNPHTKLIRKVTILDIEELDLDQRLHMKDLKS